MATRYGWMADTDTTAFQALVELQRKMSADQKLAQVFEMAAMLIRGSEEGCANTTRRLVPERSSCGRRWSAWGETVSRIYGWDPDGGETP